MNLPPQQLPSAEEPEQQPVPHTPEEASVQPSPSADQSSEETQQPVLHTSEEGISTQPAPSADQSSEETQQPSVELASEDTTQPASSFEPLAEETETQLAMPSEPLAEETEPQFATFSEADGTEDAEDDEDEDAEDNEDEVSEPVRSGVFIHKGILIAAASALVIVALLAAFLVVVNRPKDPPTDWIASYTPPAGSTTGKVLYYLHWTNQNGELKGQMQLAAFANGAPQSLTAPATGLYNRDNHIIYVVITVQGQASTLTGKINDAGDTMSLNLAGVTSQSSQFVFHIGTANDFKQATKKLGSTAGTK